MITALNITNNFLEYGFKEKIDINPMKLQKLLYILYKEYLKKTGTRLFTENFEAWQYGPVLPNVHSKFKSYCGNNIKNYSLNANNTISKVIIVPNSNFDFIFNDVWNKYKKFTPLELAKFTKQKGTAWEKSIENNTYILNDEDIVIELEYEWYKKII